MFFLLLFVPKATIGITLKDAMFKCPALGKDKCPYAILITKCKGLAGNCPAFKEGCPFKICDSVGEFVEKLMQMRDTCCKGKPSYTKFFQDLLAINEAEQKKLGNCPFNAHVCPFSHDAQGKAIIPK